MMLADYLQLLRDPLDRVLDDTPIRSETFQLDQTQAAHIVSVLWLAQLVQFHPCVLVVGGRPTLPANQDDTVEREVYAEIPIHAVTHSLAATDYADSASFGLKCLFEVDADAAVRVPLPFYRPGARPVAWAAFRPSLMDENSNVFIDAPNLPRRGDTFYISTTRDNGLLNAVGRTGDELKADTRLHFYAESAPVATNMWGLTNDADVTVNVRFDVELSDESFAAAVEKLVATPMTKERVLAAVRAVIVDYRQLVSE